MELVQRCAVGRAGGRRGVRARRSGPKPCSMDRSARRRRSEPEERNCWLLRITRGPRSSIPVPVVLSRLLVPFILLVFITATFSLVFLILTSCKNVFYRSAGLSEPRKAALFVMIYPERQEPISAPKLAGMHHLGSVPRGMVLSFPGNMVEVSP